LGAAGKSVTKERFVVLHDVIYEYLNMTIGMIKHIHPYADQLMWGLLIMDTVFMGFNIAFGKLASVEAIVERLLIMGFIIYLVTNFDTLAYMLKNSIIKILGSSVNTSIFSDPTQIMSWAHHNLIGPMNAAIEKIDAQYTPPGFNITNPQAWLAASMQHMMDVWNVRLIFNILFLGIMIAFIIIAVEITLAIIEFYLIVLFALVVLPFIAWEPLRFIGIRAFTAVIAQSMKLGIIVAVVSLGMQVMNNLNAYMLSFTNLAGTLNTDLSVLALVLGSCAVLVFLCLQVPALAMSIIAGTPAFSSMTFSQNMIGIAGVGYAFMRGIRNVADTMPRSSWVASVAAPQQVQTSHSTSITTVPTSGAVSTGGGTQSTYRVSAGNVPRYEGQINAVNPVPEQKTIPPTKESSADQLYRPGGKGGSET
jgi:type IV secretion system protein TrbL